METIRDPQFLHDLIAGIVFGDAPFDPAEIMLPLSIECVFQEPDEVSRDAEIPLIRNINLGGMHGMIILNSMLSVLCWLLGHDHNPTIDLFITQVFSILHERGFEFGDPEEILGRAFSEFIQALDMEDFKDE